MKTDPELLDKVRRLIGKGATPEEIGRKLGKTPDIVENAIEAIYGDASQRYEGSARKQFAHYSVQSENLESDIDRFIYENWNDERSRGAIASSFKTKRDIINDRFKFARDLGLINAKNDVVEAGDVKTAELIREASNRLESLKETMAAREEGDILDVKVTVPQKFMKKMRKPKGLKKT